ERDGRLIRKSPRVQQGLRQVFAIETFQLSVVVLCSPRNSFDHQMLQTTRRKFKVPMVTFV
ncbi:183_t:CDS:2, partial [Ambispora leptoticha]